MKNIYHHVKGFSVDAVPASTCHTRVGSRVGRAAFSPDQKLCINVYQCWANNFNVGDLKHSCTLSGSHSFQENITEAPNSLFVTRVTGGMENLNWLSSPAKAH